VSEDAVNVKFGATIEELLAKLNTAGGAVQTTVNGMKGHLNELSGTLATLRTQIGLVVFAVAGGSMFKEFIDKTNEMNTEALKLGRTMGISATEAGVLAVAIGDSGSTVEKYEGAYKAFARQLKSNGDELVRLGYLEADYKNRDTRKVFEDATRKVQEYTEGIQRSTAAQTLFGRSAQDVSKLARVDEHMDEARKKVASLNMTITSEGVTASRKYKEAMNDVGDVVLAVQKAIGERVIPRFTELANKFSEMGPQFVKATGEIVEAFQRIQGEVTKTVMLLLTEIKNGVLGSNNELAKLGDTGKESLLKIELRGLIVLFIMLSKTVELAVTSAKVALATLIGPLVEMTNVLDRMWAGDREGARTALKRIFTGWTDVAAHGGQDIVDVMRRAGREAHEAMTGALGEPTKGTALPPPKNGKDAPVKGEDGIAKANIALKQAEAQAELNSLRQSLKEIQDEYDYAYKNNLTSTVEYYAAKLSIETQGINASIAEKKRELDAIDSERKPKNEQERLQIAAQRAKIVGEIIVLEQQLADASVKNNRDVTTAERDRLTKLAEIQATGAKAAADAKLAIEEAEIKQAQAMGLIDEQESLSRQRSIADKKLAIDRAYFDARRALANNDAAVLAQIAQDELRAKEENNAKLLELDRARELERTKLTRQATDSIQASFTSFIETVATGTTSIKKALLSLVSSISAAISKIAAEMLAKQLFGSQQGGGGFGSLISGFIGQMFGAGGGIGGAGGGGIDAGFSAGGKLPGRADGGPVSASKAYMVGERGPEMFIPKTAGTVVPNGQTGSLSVTNHFNVPAPTDIRTQQQISAAAGQGVSRAMRRNR
jgi:hypothetical protein